MAKKQIKIISFDPRHTEFYHVSLKGTKNPVKAMNDLRKIVEEEKIGKIGQTFSQKVDCFYPEAQEWYFAFQVDPSYSPKKGESPEGNFYKNKSKLISSLTNFDMSLISIEKELSLSKLPSK